MRNKDVKAAHKLQIKNANVFWPLPLAKILKKNDTQGGHKFGETFILINFYLEYNLQNNLEATLYQDVKGGCTLM